MILDMFYSQIKCPFKALETSEKDLAVPKRRARVVIVDEGASRI